MAAFATLSDGPSWGQCAPYGGAGWIELPDGEILIFGQHSAFPALPEAACEILDRATLRRLLKAGADRPWEAEQVRRIWVEMNPSIQQSWVLDAMINDLTDWDMYAQGVGRLRAYKFYPMSLASASIMGAESKQAIAREYGTALPEAGGGDVAAMSYGQRAVAAMPYALDAIGPELKDEFSKLLEPEALAVMVAAIVVLAGVAMTGVGTAALVVIFWALVGWVAFDLARALWRFLDAIGTAQTEADLKEAGRLFAEFLAMVGVEIGMLGLFGIAGKFAKAAGGAVKARKAAQASDDVPVNTAIDDIPAGAAGSPQHKATRWQEYQDRGGEWNYDRWSQTYDNNMVRARDAHAIVDSYHQRLGWGEREITIKDVGGTGQTRRLDIADVTTQRGVEVKSGYASLDEAIRSELARDRLLVDEGWDIRWHFEGTASQPLKEALTNAGIPYTGGS